MYYFKIKIEFLFFLIISVISQNPFMKKTCGYENHLGTKTPYRNVANMDTTPFKYKGCVPKKILMIIRHGTRYPSVQYITMINELLPLIRDDIVKNAKISEEDLLKLKNWKPIVKEDDEKNLAHEGEDEMIELAERMQARFPQLFPTIYSNSTYKFRFTATQRTKDSANNFAIGLFGRPTSQHVWYPVPSTKDPILRFYKLCQKWRREIKKNPEALKERTLFTESEEMNKILKEFKKKIGYDVNFNQTHLMYMTCAFETSWYKYKKSPWCSLFNKDEIKMMEYSEDLKYYWIDGYGFNLTYLQACPVIENLVEFFQRKEELPKTVLYFTHSGTLLKVLAHLGLYKDDLPLLHSNFTQQENRKWRVSQIDSFGTNIAFILYKCEDAEKILVLHQERPVRLPGCLESDLCDFNAFINTYNKSINDCDFDIMCLNNKQ